MPQGNHPPRAGAAGSPQACRAQPQTTRPQTGGPGRRSRPLPGRRGDGGGDLKARIAEFYALFYGVELDDAALDALLEAG